MFQNTRRAIAQPLGRLRFAPQFESSAVYALVGRPATAYRGLSIPAEVGRASTRDGAAFDFVSSGTPSVLVTGTQDFVVDGSSFTLLLQGRTSGSNSNAVFGPAAAFSVDANYFDLFLPFSDGTVYWRWGGATEGTSSLSVSGLTFAQTDWWAFTVGPRGMEMWQNGIKVGSNSGTSSRTGTAGALIGGGAVGVGTDLGLRGAMLATFRRQLPAAFLARRDYWGVFATQRRTYLNTVAAAGSTRGMPFGRGAAFNGGRTFVGPIA